MERRCKQLIRSDTKFDTLMLALVWFLFRSACVFECTMYMRVHSMEAHVCLSIDWNGYLEARRQGREFGLAMMTIHVRRVGMAAAWRSLRDPNSC